MITCFGFLVFFSCELANAPAIDAGRFCKIAKPIRWSRSDTRYTKEQADEHNRVGKRLCGWRGKESK